MKFLHPLGIIYSLIIGIRNSLYNRGFLRLYSLGARTISVGNLTTGGTGKTPLVALIAKTLAEHGETVCILTRGYGRKDPRERVLVSDGKRVLSDAAMGGDEPVELAQQLFGKAIVIADANRVAAARWAVEKFGITVFILDDGFQHRRAKRDLDIVCIDATNPCGNGRMLPAGPLRESFKGMERADVIVITRANLAGDTDALEAGLKNHNAAAPIFRASTRVREIKEFHAKTQSPQNKKPEVVFAFCALGNPDSFFSLAAGELDLAGHEAFRDHHYYDQSDIDRITNLARECGAKALLTSAKDAVKLDGLLFGLPCYVIQIETVVEDAKAFRDLIISS